MTLTEKICNLSRCTFYISETLSILRDDIAAEDNNYYIVMLMHKVPTKPHDKAIIKIICLYFTFPHRIQ